MRSSTPDLLTLLNWADQTATGSPCVPWERWRASADDAPWKAAHIQQAQALLLTASRTLDDEWEVSAEDVAQFAEGRLQPPAADHVEQRCWQSLPQMAELISTVRFLRQQSAEDASPDLESRLLGLAPLPRERTNGKPHKFRLEGATTAAELPADADGPTAVEPPPPPPATLRLAHSNRDLPVLGYWQVVAAALVLCIVFSGLAGWFAATWRHRALQAVPMANSPVENEPDIAVQPKDEVPNRSTTVPQTPAIPSPPTGSAPLPPPDGFNPPVLPTQDEKSSPQRVSPPTAPRIRPRIAPPRPQLAVHSAVGMLLADPGPRGVWRVAPPNIVLSEPVHLVSLAESWTIVEVPDLGTLIWEGNAEGGLQMLLDDLVEIRLAHGRMAIERLTAGAQVRLATGDAAWTVRGVDGESTVALICDPLSPSVLVISGAVLVEETEVVAGQLTRWIDGAPQAPQPIVPVAAAAASANATSLTPPVMNPLDLAWLKPPDETARQQWRAVYGRLVGQLSASNDVAAALPRLLSATREPRQAALLARWSVALTGSAEMPQKTWDLLADRRAAVRVAGVKSILELPPGDERLKKIDQLLLAKVGGPTADRIKQWHASAWLPSAPPKQQADEIVAHLQHKDLEVRQFAISFLELYTAPAFQQLGTAPPAYDATATEARRATAQLQWINIINQLYSPARKPVLTPRQMLQNAIQGNGT